MSIEHLLSEKNFPYFLMLGLPGVIICVAQYHARIFSTNLRRMLIKFLGWWRKWMISLGG